METPRNYQVGYWYAEYGTVVVKATSPEEAESKVQEALSTEGTDGIDKFDNVRINSTDLGAQDAELVDL